MSQVMKAAMAVCLATSLAAQADAGYVGFRGTTVGGNPLFGPGSPVVLDLTFAPAVGFTAPVTTAFVQIGAETWSAFGGGSVTIIPNGAAPDDLSVALTFAPSTPGGLGTASAVFNLTINGVEEIPPPVDATEANVHLVAKNGNVASGTMTLVGGEIPGFVLATPFSGTAVPEPGSVALLGGLGLVLAGGAWRRRRQSAKAAA